MFALLRAEVDDRFLLIQQILNTLGHIETDSSFPPDVPRTLKGLVFVQLYAVYEHCVCNAVQAALRSVNRQALSLRELRHELLAMALDDGCKSLSNCGTERMWPVRVMLLGKSRSAEAAEIPENLFPADGSHYRIGQLRTIWTLFGMASPEVPDNRLIGRIDELVELRNGIAHGRLRAEEVGRRFSLNDLQDRFVDTGEICRHVLSELEAHVSDPAALRA